jgi:hypothetical protein
MGVALFLIFAITAAVVGPITCFVCDIAAFKHDVLKIDTDFLNNNSLDSIEDWLTY